ncbi:LuxR C-terminal-related transcriptional regulator, partial [Pseudomonas aeruginosa]|uniref:LuxR C-terminal-related transcriptional regulator n=1 Tax=Pseudomonas aeruginosa TaxID=287 RepID=UPI0021AB0E11
ELTFSKILDSFSSRSDFFYTLKCEEPVICNCSEANVNFHMGNIRRKFGVTSRRVAAIMAVNLGLITL